MYNYTYKVAENEFFEWDDKKNEDRFFCIGKCEGSIMTVRFTMRDKRIRIFGAGFWRKGRAMYEEKNNL